MTTDDQPQPLVDVDHALESEMAGPSKRNGAAPSIAVLYETLQRAPVHELDSLLHSLNAADEKSVAMLKTLKTKQQALYAVSAVLEQAIKTRFAEWAATVRRGAATSPPSPLVAPGLAEAVTRLYASPGAVAAVFDICLERVEIPHFWQQLFSSLCRDLYSPGAKRDNELASYLLCCTIRLVAGKEIARAAKREPSLQKLGIWRDGVVNSLFGVLALHLAASAHNELCAEVSKIFRVTTSLDVNPLAIELELEKKTKSDSIYFNGTSAANDVAQARKAYNSGAKVKRLVDSRVAKLAELTGTLFSALKSIVLDSPIAHAHDTLRAIRADLDRHYDGQDVALALARVVFVSWLLPALQTAAGKAKPLAQANLSAVLDALRACLADEAAFQEPWLAPLAAVRDDAREQAGKLHLSERSVESIAPALVRAHTRPQFQAVVVSRRTLAFVQHVLPLLVRRQQFNGFAPMANGYGGVAEVDDDRFLESAHKLDDDWGVALDLTLSALCPVDAAVTRLDDLVHLDTVAVVLVPRLCAAIAAPSSPRVELPRVPKGRLAVLEALCSVPAEAFVDDLHAMVAKYGDAQAVAALENQAVDLFVERMNADAVERIALLSAMRRSMQRVQSVKEDVAAALKSVDAGKAAVDAYLAFISQGDKADAQNRRMAKSVADRLGVALTPLVNFRPVAPSLLAPAVAHDDALLDGERDAARWCSCVYWGHRTGKARGNDDDV